MTRPRMDFARANSDTTATMMLLPHSGHPGCGMTVLNNGQVALHRLGLMPVRCKGCGELLTDREDV